VIKVLVLLINIAIVVYLVYRIRHRRAGTPEGVQGVEAKASDHVKGGGKYQIGM